MFIDRSVELGYTESFILAVLGWGLFGWDPLPIWKPFVEEAVTLIPTEWQKVISEKDLKRIKPKLKDEDRKARWDAIPSIPDWWGTFPKGEEADTLVAEVFPFRTKTDRNIRRSRMLDIYTFYNKLGKDEIFWERLGALLGWDYITVMNVMWAGELLNSDTFTWWKTFNTIGAFDGTIEHYILCAKWFTDLIKTRKTIFPKNLAVECAGLTGYRNPPFPGFDYKLETQRLVQKGLDDHSLYDPSHFERKAKELLVFEPSEDREHTEFKDWVKQGDWTTSGASSLGKVEWKVNGEIGKTKARKNIAPDVLDLAELAQQAYDSDKQVSYSIIKSELGKIRIAVASDLESYLQMTWISEIAGHSYKKWPGMTLEEDVNQQTDRMIEMIALCSDHYGVPYDYKNFDHQITTKEIKVIARIIIDAARLNVPVGGLADFEHIAANVMRSFDQSTLEARGEEDAKFFVESGLISGMRWTSIIGNCWNLIITAMAAEIISKIGVSLNGVKSFVRGDDSAIYAPKFIQALSVKLGYDVLQAESGEGKFGILTNEMEFLRLWYDKEKVTGYASRAIPGLSQRKPWTSSPWGEYTVIETLFDVVKTLKRRGVDEKTADAAWSSLKQVWSKKSKIPTYCLQIPVPYGGCGIEPWDGKQILKTPVPRVGQDLFIDVTNSTQWRTDNLVKLAEQHSAKADFDKAKQLADQKRQNILIADDIPEVNRALRDRYKQKAQGWKAEFISVREDDRIRHPLPLFDKYLSLLDKTPGKLKEMTETLQHSARFFNRHRRLASIWRDLADVKFMDKGFTPSVYLHTNFPEIYADLKLLERAGMHRTEAIDWLSGTIAGIVKRKLHGTLSKILTSAVAATIHDPTKKKWRGSRLYGKVSLYTQQLENQLLETELAKCVYSW